MLRKGYIEQQIEGLGMVLSRVLRLTTDKNYIAAIAEIHAGCKRLTGLDIDTVARLPEQTIVGLCGGAMGAGAGNAATVSDAFDGGKCLILATLLREQAQIYRLERREEDACTMERKALALLAETLTRDEFLQTPDLRAQVELQVVSVKLSGGMTASLWYRMAKYYEAVGSYGKAEDALYVLREAGHPGARGEAVAFYERLRGLSDDALLAGDLPREEVEEALAGLNR